MQYGGLIAHGLHDVVAAYHTLNLLTLLLYKINARSLISCLFFVHSA